jgi:hypothetical protein
MCGVGFQNSATSNIKGFPTSRQTVQMPSSELIIFGGRGKATLELGSVSV